MYDAQCHPPPIKLHHTILVFVEMSNKRFFTFLNKDNEFSVSHDSRLMVMIHQNVLFISIMLHKGSLPVYLLN